MKKEPIFVVGVPRSGTTLLAAILAAHSNMSCGPETHFFRWLAKTDVDQILNSETWPEPAINFICSITRKSFSANDSKYLIDKYQVEKQDITRYLENKEPSIAHVLSAITEPYMMAMKKSRWVEKTPDHIEHVQLIRKYFPEAPIIRIIRDPRDVALSLTKVPWGAQTPLEALLLWKRLDEASEEFFSTDHLCYTIHFEDLVLSPQEELQKLCQFLGEEFEEAMLDTSSTGKQINSRNVPWKDKVSQPIDASRTSVWRDKLTKQENQLAEAVLGDRMKVYRYPREENFVQLGEIYPEFSLAPSYAHSLTRLSSTGIRFWKTHKDEKPTVKIYLGDPGNSSWLKRKKTERLVNTLSISVDVIKAIVSKDFVYWIPDKNGLEWSGYCSFLLKKILAPYKIASDNGDENNC